jgi:exosome complex exonuclease RRP6
MGNPNSSNDGKEEEEEGGKEETSSSSSSEVVTADTDTDALLSALAAGVRAVRGIPTGDDGRGDDDTDDLAYLSSFPEGSKALREAQAAWLETVQAALRELDGTAAEGRVSASDVVAAAATTAATAATNVDDPVLWEELADACDALAEQVEEATAAAVVVGQQGVPGVVRQQQQQQLQRISTAARQQGQRNLDRVVSNTRDLPKPQDVYRMKVQNSRTEPFVPPHQATAPTPPPLQPGHGLESRFGELKPSARNNLPSDMVAPTQHCPHLCEKEIRSFSYTKEQLEAAEPGSPFIQVDCGDDNPILLPFTWIDTEKDLNRLALDLKKGCCTGIALDLEAHSYRSFAGLTCLMQLSHYRRDEDGRQMQNYLVDTLALRGSIHEHLAPVLADPAIVKVMHGADGDVQWLQRDFGCYVVNLFDTYRAAVLLKRAGVLSALSYAALLRHYTDGRVQTDKAHQLGDWRRRPLPDDMKQYAVTDTHYLLDIYERIKWDLEQQQQQRQQHDCSVKTVFDASRQVCLIRYAVEPFCPTGYEKLLLRHQRRGAPRRRDTDFTTPSQRGVLRTLWDWRDAAARSHDESLQYVCPDRSLLRMSMAATRIITVSQLHSLFNPVPPLVMRYSREIVDRIQRALLRETEQGEEQDQGPVIDEAPPDDDEEEEEEEEEMAVGAAPSSAFFKPAVTDKKELRRRSMMSPVLGTEDLYKQAGWMTPLELRDEAGDEVALTTASAATTTDEDDAALAGEESPSELPVPGHSLDFGKGVSRGRSVDGMGSVRGARDCSKSPVQCSIEEEAARSRQKASSIKRSMAQKERLPEVLGLIAPGVGDEEMTVDEKPVRDEIQDGSEDQELEEEEGEGEFVIPRSIREIYMISNRNRHRKKAGSPTPERGLMPASEKEREELAKAEALLKDCVSAVAGYFDKSAGASPPGKRPRTKSGHESEESVSSGAVPSKEEDVRFMKGIGWLDKSDNAESIVKQPYAGGGRVESTGSQNVQVVVKELNRHTMYDGPGVLPTSQQSNPFFQGEALKGCPLTQRMAKSDHPRKNSAPGNSGGKRTGRRQERPVKTNSRSHAYRKRTENQR